MNVELTHKLEFKTNREPTIQELFAMLKTAEQQGFPPETPVYVNAGTDDRDHDYYFRATIGRQEAP